MRTLLSAIFVMALLTLASCQSNEEYISEVNATLKLSSTENNVWRTIGTRAATSTNDFYYVLDANSICKTAVGDKHGTLKIKYHV